DLRSLLKASGTPPEEAAQNIDRSNFFGISPDSYKGLKSELDPEIMSFERTPASVEPVTDETIKQSEQHLNLYKDDIDKMNAFEKRAKYLKLKSFDIPDKRREMNEVLNKVFDGQELDEGERQYVQD